MLATLYELICPQFVRCCLIFPRQTTRSHSFMSNRGRGGSTFRPHLQLPRAIGRASGAVSQALNGCAAQHSRRFPLFHLNNIKLHAMYHVPLL
jgi:hypothetical protein